MSEKAAGGLSTETVGRILAFRDERDWRPFHNPKDLAISISLEAAELLELFQWSGADLEAVKKRGELAEELADVLIYAVLLADRTGLGLDDIVRAKLEKNARRYPADLSRGSSAKYTELKATGRCAAADAGDGPSEVITGA